MSSLWSRFACYVGPCLSWWSRRRILGGEAVQDGTGEVQDDIVLGGGGQAVSGSRVKNRKLVMAGIILVPVFVGWFMGKDPSQLTGIVGVIFSAFVVGDAANTYSYRKFGNGDDSNAGSAG